MRVRISGSRWLLARTPALLCGVVSFDLYAQFPRWRYAVSTHCRSCCRPGLVEEQFYLTVPLTITLPSIDGRRNRGPGTFAQPLEYPIFRCPRHRSSSEIRRARDGSALDRAGRVVCSLCLAGLCRAGQRFAFSARCSDGCSDDLIFSCPIHQPLILNARPDIATVPQLVVTFAAISVAFERWLRSKILNTRITAKTSAMPLIESNLCSW